jgi:uncharacterized protein (DUF1697 family)
MRYVALLRGINVGGNNKVDMKILKDAFERVGMNDVRTYINSGNVIFTDNLHTAKEITKKLEDIIKETFGFAVKVLLRDQDQIWAIAAVLPESWQNNSDMRCDVMFLGDDIDNSEIVDSLTVKPEIEDVRYVPGAILWRVDRRNVTRSGMLKLVGTELYKKMTIRNCNTVRRILQLI